MRADVLAGFDRSACGRRRSGFRLVDTANRKAPKRGQRPGTHARPLEKSTTIQLDV